MRLISILAAGAVILTALPVAPQASAQTPPASAPATTPTEHGGLSLGQLAMMERVGDPRISPDGRRILYGVRTTDWGGNRGVGALWVIENDGTPRRLTISDGGAGSGRWSTDGRAIYFLSARGGSSPLLSISATRAIGRLSTVTKASAWMNHFAISSCLFM